MPFGYLITIAILGVAAIAALIRPPGYGRLGRLTFFLAVAINELPHIAALWLILSAALALSEGDLDGPVGAILLTPSAAIFLGLMVLLRRCLMAGSVISQLAHVHTSPAHARVSRAHAHENPAKAHGLPRWTWLRPLLFPIPVRPGSVTRIGALSYGEHRRQRLDVYRHRNRALRGPVLVYFHGGGYSSGGNRREGRALLHHLAAQGWVCISATYRLRPEADFTDHLDDARAVLRWARDNAELHGGDPSTIVMSGSSAGAHMTSLLALGQGERETPRIAAGLCLYGYYGRYFGRGEDEHPVSTPLALDASAAPPMFFAHGDNDSWAPIEDARRLHEHVAAESKQPTWFADFPGGQHGLDAFVSWRFAATIHGIDLFLEHIGIEPPPQHSHTDQIDEGASS